MKTILRLKWFERVLLFTLIVGFSTGIYFVLPSLPSRLMIYFNIPLAYAGEYRIVGEESISVSTTTMGLTASKYISGNKILADYAFITVHQTSGGIIFSLLGIGGGLSTTNGHPVVAGQNITLTNFSELRGFMSLRAVSTNARLYVTFKKWYQ